MAVMQGPVKGQVLPGGSYGELCIMAGPACCLHGAGAAFSLHLLMAGDAVVMKYFHAGGDISICNALESEFHCVFGCLLMAFGTLALHSTGVAVVEKLHKGHLPVCCMGAAADGHNVRAVLIRIIHGPCAGKGGKGK